jgi:hypothetical protein
MQANLDGLAGCKEVMKALSARITALATDKGTSSLSLCLRCSALTLTVQMFAVLACVILSSWVQDGHAQEALQSSGSQVPHSSAIAAPFEEAQQFTAAPNSVSSSEPSVGSPIPAAAKNTGRQASPLIVIGFMGGRIRADNTVHREATFAAQLQRDYPGEIHAEVFANRDGRNAYQEVLRLLDANHDGVLSPMEKRHARIVIYGHSWGASETVSLARRLGRDGIPVLLTVQVDSVAKKGEQDEYIPANVIQAANFYQLTGLLHGRRTIRAVDPAKTKIVGNFQLEYRDHHVQCRQYPWYARAFMRPHIEIENDPRVWTRIETMIQAKLPDTKITNATALASRAQ